MEHLTPLFAIIVVSASALTSLVVWSRHGVWPKLAALGLSTVLMGSGYLGFVELLSRPKPTTMEWAQDATQNATVLSVNMREDEVIYLWLVPAGSKEPRSYAMPWNKQRAQQLDSVMRQAQEDGSEVIMRGDEDEDDELGYADGLEDPHDRPMFYVAPQQPLPPKDYAPLVPLPSLPGQGVTPGQPGQGT